MSSSGTVNFDSRLCDNGDGDIWRWSAARAFARSRKGRREGGHWRVRVTVKFASGWEKCLYVFGVVRGKRGRCRRSRSGIADGVRIALSESTVRRGAAQRPVR